MWVGIAVAVLLAVVGAVAFLGAADDDSDLTAVSAATLPGEEGSGSQSSASPAQQEEKPWLGVMLVQTPDGVTINHVIADSPADTAALQRGDVIEAVDGTEVDNVREFRDQFDDKNVGDTITLSISRDGEARDISVTLEVRPEPLPRPIPLLPELEGMPPDELFDNILGGQFDLRDEEGNPLTVVLEVGTVASVDADAGGLTVDLNAGGTKTYTVGDDDLIFRGELSDLEEGDNVTVMTVNDDVRAVFRGGRFPFIPGLGGKHGGFGFGHGRFGDRGFWNGSYGSFSVPDQRRS